jgi:hypothetical protein
MLKLILRLFRLLCSLLFLDQSVSVFGFGGDLLSVGLSSDFIVIARLSCLLATAAVSVNLSLIVLNLLFQQLLLLVLSSNAQGFLYVTLINQVHALTLNRSSLHS